MSPEERKQAGTVRIAWFRQIIWMQILSGTNSSNYMVTEALGHSVSFMLCEKSGNLVYVRSIPLSEMERGCYYDVPVNQKVKAGEPYYWSIGAPMDMKCDWKPMYTERVEDQAPERSMKQDGRVI